MTEITVKRCGPRADLLSADAWAEALTNTAAGALWVGAVVGIVAFLACALIGLI